MYSTVIAEVQSISLPLDPAISAVQLDVKCTILFRIIYRFANPNYSNFSLITNKASLFDSHLSYHTLCAILLSERNLTK